MIREQDIWRRLKLETVRYEELVPGDLVASDIDVDTMLVETVYSLIEGKDRGKILVQGEQDYGQNSWVGRPESRCERVPHAAMDDWRLRDE